MKRKGVAMIWGVAFAVALIAGVAWATRDAWSKRRDVAAKSLMATLGGNAAQMDGLGEVWSERSEIVRMNRLAEWVAGHSFEEGRAALWALRGKRWWELRVLLLAKLTEAEPGTDEKEFEKRVDRPRALPTVFREKNRGAQLAELAKTEPAEALKQALAETWVAEDRTDAMRQIFWQVSQANPELAVRMLAESKGVNRPQIRQMIAEGWAAKDPANALAWVQALPGSETNDELAETVLGIWAKTDLGAAVEAAIETGGAVRDSRAVATLLRSWLKESPEASAEWLQTLPEVDTRVRKAAIEALSGSHPLLVASLLSGPMTRDERRQGMVALVEAWSARDSAAAWAWLNGQPRGDAFFDAAGALMKKMAVTAPGAAMVLYESLPEGGARDRVAGEIARGMTDKGAALSWLASLPDAVEIRHGVARLISEMDLKEPAAVLALLQKIPSASGQLQIYSTAAQTWMSADPQGAVAWIRTLKDPEVLKTVGSSIGYLWAERAPAEMADFVSTLERGPAFETMVSMLSSNWARNDATAAADWLATLPDSEAVRGGVNAAFQALAAKDPVTMRQKLAGMPAGALRAEALGGAVTGLASSQPEQAGRLILDMAMPAEQPAVVARLVEAWARRDSEKALAWTTSLGQGEARDRGLITIINRIGEESPQRAIALVSLASTEAVRVQLAGDAVLAWYRRDSKAAMDALGGLSLGEEQKAGIQRRCADEY